MRLSGQFDRASIQLGRPPFGAAVLAYLWLVYADIAILRNRASTDWPG